MSSGAIIDLFNLCSLKERPLTDQDVQLKNLLAATDSPSCTVEECYDPEECADFLKGVVSTNKANQVLSPKHLEAVTGNTSALHVLFYALPDDLTGNEQKIVSNMVDSLLMSGLPWNLVDFQGSTPGCILVKRGMNGELYDKMVDAGVRSELLFRMMNSNGDHEEEEEEEEGEGEGIVVVKDVEKALEDPDKLVHESSAFLNSQLTYTDNALVTENQDGVMMNWETKLMKIGCDSLFKNITDQEEACVLNIGFGMGIIDTLIEHKISQYHATKFTHYICEAHPDVLKKLREDGWYEKPGVTILEGRWQDCLNTLLDDGNVFFHGIYYDTFGEHYSPDMYPNLFDCVVGLLAPDGVMSFFNGLGADRQIVYDVYRKIVSLDLADYGMDVTYQTIAVDAETEGRVNNEGKKGVWNNVRRSYWECEVYYHPEICFA